MDDCHRKLILENTDRLIQLTDYKILMNACIITNLLFPRMRNFIECEPLPENYSNEDKEKEFHKNLLVKITERGPNAFEKFIMILSELKYDKAVQLLRQHRYNEGREFTLGNVKTFENKELINLSMASDPPADTSRRPLHNNYDNWDEEPKLELYTGKIGRKYNVIKSKNIHVDTFGTYTMKSRDNRGVLFVVNIIEFLNDEDRRNGAEQDTNSLLCLFEQLGFKLFSYINISSKQFLTLLEELLNSKYTHQTECFVLVLMTHGFVQNSVEYVRFKDGVVKVNVIEEHFQSHLSPNLTKKPKILIFPFCRGDRPDIGVSQQVETEGGGKPRGLPTLSDVLICYAVSRGYLAHREATNGSWYIQKLCELMAQHAHEFDFESILKLVGRKISLMRAPDTGAHQTPSGSHIGFNYKLYFNPGCYEQDGKSICN